MKAQLKKEYTYIVCAEHRLTGKILNTSNLMTGEQVEKDFGSVCLDLYFNAEPDFPFDEIEFKIMRVDSSESDKSYDKKLVYRFDNMILTYSSKLEKTRCYNDAQMLLLNAAFSKIRFMFSKFLFVNDFTSAIKLNGLANKVFAELQSLIFLSDEDIVLVISWINDFLINTQMHSSDEEKYEISSNIKKYLSANNIYTQTK